MENIEQLRKEVDEIRTSLNTLKSNVSLSDSEKKSKVESIKSQAETVKDKIQKRISSLENKSDAASKKEKEEAQALLDSFSEITSLYNSITNTPKNTPKTTPSTQSQQSETVSQNKNIFEKAKDWIWTQWKDIWKQEKWDESPWTNILRTLWFAATWIWGAALAYKWLKSLWNSTFWKKKKKGKDTDNESDAKEKDNTPEKKSFWNTKFWKALTWLWIWSAAWGGVYFLGKKFNRWWKSSDKPTDNWSTHIEWWNLGKSKVDHSGGKYEIDNFNITASPESKQIWENLKWKEKPELEPFVCAMKAYKEEKEKWHLNNTKYITVVDFTKNQLTNNRLFVINLENNTVEYAEKCWHWAGSGWENWATSFSNKSGTNKSSLWAFITPDHSKKSNTKSRTWSYPAWQESSNNASQWRWIAIHPVRSLVYRSGTPTSLGCFTIPASQSYVNGILDKINKKSLFFAYAKSKNYFTQSKYFQQNSNGGFTA